jgi:hypothetical protein
VADSLRARLRDALVGLKFGLGTNARYGLSGREVEEATEQLLPMVEAELYRLAAERDDWRNAAYQHARERDEAVAPSSVSASSPRSGSEKTGPCLPRPSCRQPQRACTEH